MREQERESRGGEWDGEAERSERVELVIDGGGEESDGAK